MAGRGKKEEGSVPAYMNARLQSAVGKTLTLAALHSDYQAWCRAEKLTALKRQVFAEVLSKTAGEVGLESANEGREKVWLDVELVG